MTGESWFISSWRPALAWTFISVVVYDLILAPLLMQFMFAIGNKPYQEWHPSTMLAGGMFFGAFGAILGTATYMRSQEKLAVFNGPTGGTVSSSSTTISSTEQKRNPPAPETGATTVISNRDG